jgi:hypothetical protein
MGLLLLYVQKVGHVGYVLPIPSPRPLKIWLGVVCNCAWPIVTGQPQVQMPRAVIFERLTNYLKQPHAVSFAESFQKSRLYCVGGANGYICPTS